MSALDDYFDNKNKATTKSTGSAIDAYFESKGVNPIKASVSSTPTSTATSSPQAYKAPYNAPQGQGGSYAGKDPEGFRQPTNFKTTDIKGYPVGGYVEAGGYGASLKSDPYSKEPLLTKTTSKGVAIEDRVAAKFDITKPQKLTRDVLTNDRLPLSASQKLKGQLGGAHSDELDHKIALALRGSNLMANLQIEPGRQGGQASRNDILENHLAYDVIGGKISLLDAQRQLAQAKGIFLFEEVPPIVNEWPKPIEENQFKQPADFKQAESFGGDGLLFSRIKNAVENFITQNPITQEIANNKGLVGNIIANLQADTPQAREKSVKIAEERQVRYKKLIAEGKSEKEALYLTKALPTPTEAQEIMNFAMGFVGGPEGEIKPKAKGASNLSKGKGKPSPQDFELKSQLSEPIPQDQKLIAPDNINISSNKPSVPSMADDNLLLSPEELLQKSNTRIKDLQNFDASLSITKSKPISQELNIDRLNISDEGKQVIQQTIEEMKPRIEEFTGGTLSNQEVLNLAENSSKVLKRAVGQESTLQWESAMLKARQDLAAAAQSGVVDKNFVENLLTIKTQATDIARKLQSLSIKADPVGITSKEAILDAVLKVNKNVEEITKAAEGVDFNNFQQASDFYRKFVKPSAQEWIDLIRYNSMLSSPKTHIVNIFSNLVNTSFIAPIEKALTGGLDFLGSKITGSQRKYFAGEGGAYLKAYYSNVREATHSFADVMRGKSASTNLDTRNIPIATKGIKGAIASTLSYPLKLLEGVDRFFMTLGKNAEESALTLREARGVKVPLKSIQAENSAAYRVFRQELFSPDQGRVLDAVDQFTNFIQGLRSNTNPIVSTIAKYTVPFLKTPMNIFKQGIEYSPAGFSTLWGSSNKVQQLSKAILGSTVFAGAATLLTSGRLTWSEPTNANDRSDFKAAGKQAYSIKIGDTWVAYQKLPPGLSFPMAIVAAIDDLFKNKKADDNFGDMVLGGVAKYGDFLADQSYAKSIGDLLNATKGGDEGVTRLLSNYPQQLVPFRALTGWLARLFDASQRKVDSKASFIEQQIQQFMLQYPGLSQKVPARTDSKGNPISANSNVINAFSPVNISKSNKELEDFLNQKFDVKSELSQAADKKAKAKEAFMPKYEEIQAVRERSVEEADAMVNKLSDQEWDIYKSLKATDKRRRATEMEAKIYPKYQEAQELKKAGKEQEAQNLVDGLTDEEYKAYKALKDKLAQ